MGKSVKAEIVTVEGTTLKVDKLVDRTFRTIAVGDYIPVRLNVRGTMCHLYARVTSRANEAVSFVFGSHGGNGVVMLPKGYKGNVYRPIQ